MKLALVAVIVTMLFALQSALAAPESAIDIAESLLDANELPKKTKTIQIVEETEEVAEVAADEITLEASASSEDIAEENTTAPVEENERQPAAAATEETMFAEAPGSIDFDMATIFMIEDAPEAPKKNFSKVANGN